MSGDIEARKGEHIDTVLGEDVSAKGVSTGFERFFFEHAALPETDLDTVDLSTRLFGRSLKAPLLIASMTGGTASGARHQPEPRRRRRNARHRDGRGLPARDDREPGARRHLPGARRRPEHLAFRQFGRRPAQLRLWRGRGAARGRDHRRGRAVPPFQSPAGSGPGGRGPQLGRALPQGRGARRIARRSDRRQGGRQRHRGGDGGAPDRLRPRRGRCLRRRRHELERGRGPPPDRPGNPGR